jgi:predicted acyl esterase
MMADALAADLTGQHQRFFDRWLRGQADALAGSAPIRIFVMGIDQWRNEQDWPLPDTSYVGYHLHSSGRANTADGDGSYAPNPRTGSAPTVICTIRCGPFPPSAGG